MARRNKGNGGKNIKTNINPEVQSSNASQSTGVQPVSKLQLISKPEVTLTAWLCHPLAV